MTDKELLQIFKKCNYHPEEIGIMLLEKYNFNVQTFKYCDREPIISNKEGKRLNI